MPSELFGVLRVDGSHGQYVCLLRMFARVCPPWFGDGKTCTSTKVSNIVPLLD
jgi:hypothetical protein